MDNIVGVDSIHLTQTQVNQLYSILQRFETAALTVGLKYTIGCGTALGAELRGGLIPWDTDADLFAIHDHFYSLLPRLMEAVFGRLIIKKHTTFSDGRGWYKLYLPNVEYPNVDIYLFEYSVAENVWRPSDSEIRGRKKLYLDSVLPHNYTFFGPLRLPLFHAPQRFFDRYYGPKWRYAETETQANEGALIVKKSVYDFRPTLPTQIDA
jgi:hypothetical protein